MVRRSPASTVVVLALLLVQPALALAGEMHQPGTSGRFIPAGSVVLFDEAHFPVYTVNPDNPSGYNNTAAHPEGAYAAFAGALRNAGLTVRTLDYGYYLDSESLSGVKVLVIVCSQGKSKDQSVTALYTADEINAVLNFVKSGGGLFLIGDHTTFPPTILPVAEQFGIEYGQTLLHDPVNYVQNVTSGQPSDFYNVFIPFERDWGNFADHPIMENISRIELYRTDVFGSLPYDAVPLITSGPDTYLQVGIENPVPAPNQVVAAAVPEGDTTGAGRIVVLGDTNAFETDEDRNSDYTTMDLYHRDNALFGAQAVEWLADVPVHRSVNIGSAEPDSLGSHELVHKATAGNTTTFALTVANAGNVVDHYDLQVSDPSPDWKFSLGYADIELNSSEARGLSMTVLVPRGARVGDSCRLEVTARSRLDQKVSSQVNCTVTIPPVHDLSLTCPLDAIAVHAGGTASYELLLANRGNLVERLSIAADGPAGWDARVNISQGEMGPGDQRALLLQVTAPADALGGTVGRTTVTAGAMDDPGVSVSNNTFTTVMQEFAIGLACPVPRQGVDPGSLVSFPVSVANRGNGDDEVTLSLIGGSRWDTDLEPSHFLLPFNGTVELAVITRAPALSPANETLELTVLAVSVLNSSAQARLDLRAMVNGIDKFSLEIDPPVRFVDPGDQGLFNITVTGTGNMPEKVELAADGPGALTGPELDLGIGQSVRVILTVPVAPGERAGTTHLVMVSGVSATNPDVGRHVIATVVVNQVHRVRGELVPDTLYLRPGDQGRSEIRVWNEGNGPEVVSCVIERAPPGWQCALADGTLELAYLGVSAAPLEVTVPLSSRAGVYDLAVNLTDGAGAFQVLPLTVEVLRVHNFTAAISPAVMSALPGRRVAFTLSLDNLGNSPENVTLSAGGKHSSWVSPETGQATLNYSSGKDVTVFVRSDPDARAGKYQLNLTVAGEDGQSRELRFELNVKEGVTTVNDLPCWLAVVIVLAAVAAALLVRRRMQTAQREAELEKAPAEGHGKGEPAGGGRPKAIGPHAEEKPPKPRVSELDKVLAGGDEGSEAGDDATEEEGSGANGNTSGEAAPAQERRPRTP